jgi:hypothetical protein
VKKVIITGLLALGLSAVTAAPAFATSPHFTYAKVTSVTANSVTVAFKEAGLGDSLNSVTISVSGDAQCVNPGGNDPQAGNKTAFSVSGVFGVSNGQATGSETLVASNISPKCSPPMVIAWSDLVVTDATTGDSAVIPGVYFP